MIRKLISWSVDNRLLVLVLSLALVIGGVESLSRQ
jgi:Cu/Ag efflux pump CusA